MKKQIAFLSVVLLFAMLASGFSGSAAMNRVQLADEQLHMLDDSPLGKSNLKVALLTSPFGTDDLAVNRGLKQGIQDFLESDKTASVKEFVEKTGDPAACLKLADELAGKNDVVVVSGEMFSGISEVAKKHKDVKFIVFDAVPLDENENPVVLDNVTSFTYRDEECGFLAGVAAALESKSGKVAAVTATKAISDDAKTGTKEGTSDGANTNAVNNAATGTKPAYSVQESKVAANTKLGFACGVAYANKHFGTSVKVPVSDNEMTAKQLIAEGCDILYPASSACAKEVLRAAKADEGIRVIGSFIDLFPYGGNAKNNVVITSVYRTQSSDLMGELMAIAADNAQGENKELGANDYSINYYFDTDRSILSDQTDEALTKVFELLMEGKIVPASLSNGMAADEFTGL